MINSTTASLLYVLNHIIIIIQTKNFAYLYVLIDFCNLGHCICRYSGVLPRSVAHIATLADRLGKARSMVSLCTCVRLHIHTKESAYIVDLILMIFTLILIFFFFLIRVLCL